MRDDTTLPSRGLWLRPIGKSSGCFRMTAGVKSGKAQNEHMFSGLPQKQTNSRRLGMSALCHRQTHAPQHNQRAKYKRALSRRTLGTSISVFVQATAESGT